MAEETGRDEKDDNKSQPKDQKVGKKLKKKHAHPRLIKCEYCDDPKPTFTEKDFEAHMKQAHPQIYKEMFPDPEAPTIDKKGNIVDALRGILPEGMKTILIGFHENDQGKVTKHILLTDGWYNAYEVVGAINVDLTADQLIGMFQEYLKRQQIAAQQMTKK